MTIFIKQDNYQIFIKGNTNNGELDEYFYIDKENYEKERVNLVE